MQLENYLFEKTLEKAKKLVSKDGIKRYLYHKAHYKIDVNKPFTNLYLAIKKHDGEVIAVIEN